MKAIIYSRCSTDETRQDTDVQLKELRRYAEAFNWEWDEVSEYGSGYKGNQPKLSQIIEKVRRKEYAIFLVYSLDRFSRQAPRKTNALLDQIVYDYKCRFISLKESIDSDNSMVWNVMKPLFTYFANTFSQQLSEKIKAGIKNKQEKGTYKGGRPKKTYDLVKLRELSNLGCGIRKIAEFYNEGLPKKQHISHMQVSRILRRSN